jgi:hypothetical protein
MFFKMRAFDRWKVNGDEHAFQQYYSLFQGLYMHIVTHKNELGGIAFKWQ